MRDAEKRKPTKEKGDYSKPFFLSLFIGTQSITFLHKMANHTS
jgi:hypothetical protein